MTQKSINQDISSLHFSENILWRLSSNALWDGLIVALLVILVLVGGVAAERFLSPANIRSMTWAWLAVAMLAPTMGLVIASGGIDLSVGSVAALTATVMASLVVSKETSIGVAFIVGLGLAFLIGLVNGFLMGVIKLNPVIVTLAMMTMLRGICYIITDGRTIVVAEVGFLSSLAIPVVALILLIIVCIVATELKLVSGRHLLLNRASWIRQSLLIGLPYVLSSVMAGFVGALYLGRIRAAMPTIGTGLEVDAILIVLLGGTSLGGGFVNIVGAIPAALIVAMGQNIVVLNGTQASFLTVGKGAALLIFGLLCQAYYYVVNLIFTKRKSQP